MGLGKKKQQKISTEELAKTQVLNLDDVQKLAKYEKLISKKPALIVALIGGFSIIVGASAQTVVSLSKVNEPTPMPKVTNKVSTDKKETVEDLICSQTTVNEGAEIIIKTTYDVEYKDNKMTKYTKTTDVTPTNASSVNALTSIQNGQVAFKAMEAFSTTGYKVVVSNKETGYQVLVTIDPNTLDTTKLAPEVTGNQFVNANISKDQTKDQVKAALQGYTCN